ncbi:MAG TPA: hypothetical protein VL361_15700 [Candidatus Limnocylindrales bacterium]|jgi:hypothetical protein|nr:hypothetical protein [Candidatus Limnocylindrales bacterium]
MAYFIKPIEEERCVTLSYEGEIPPREIAAARYEAHGLLNARRSRIIVDLTQLRSVPTAPQLFDFAKGFAGQIPTDGRVALVVRPEQVRQANFVEKVARRDGVFLSYFIDPAKAAVWMQRSQALRRRLGPKASFQKSKPCKSHPSSTRAQDPGLREPPPHFRLFSRHRTATFGVTRAPRPRGSVVKTLISLLVVVSGGLTSACSATNDALAAPGGTVIARSGHQSASQSRPGVVTTPIRDNVLLELWAKGMDTNCLNTSGNEKLSTPGPQPTPTNSVPPEERTALGPVDMTAIPRVNQRRENFADQHKYGGILYTAYNADNPLQLINPFAPREYGQREAPELPRDLSAGVPSGFSLFAIRFK